MKPDTDNPAPDDPLGFIARCVRAGKVYWTYHVNMRMRGRFVTRRMILDSVDGYAIIEAYPNDKYMPSYLVYGAHGETVFHVLFALDLRGDNVRVVTAYRPDPSRWGDDMKERRK